MDLEFKAGGIQWKFNRIGTIFVQNINNLAKQINSKNKQYA